MKIKKIFLQHSAILLIAIVPIIFSSISFYKTSNEKSSNIVTQNLQVLASKQVKSIESFINEIQYDLDIYSHLDFFQNMNVIEMKDYIEYLEYTTNLYNNIYVLDSSGKTLVGYVQDPYEFFKKSYVKQALNGTVAISDMFKFRDEYFIEIASPILKGTSVKGVICVRISMHKIDDIMKSTQDEQTSETYIVDKTGKFLTPSRFFTNAIGEKSIDLKNLMGSVDYSKTASYKDYRGKAVYGTYLPMNENGWIMIAEQDSGQVNCDSKNILSQGLNLSIIETIFLAGLKKYIELSEKKSLENSKHDTDSNDNNTAKELDKNNDELKDILSALEDALKQNKL